jgi:hypothetical protein
MPSDNQALLLQVSADTSKALKQLDNLQNRIKGTSRQIDRSLSSTNDNLARKFGRGLGTTVRGELEGIASRAGPAAGALNGFGAAGLAAAAALGALTVAAGRAIEAMSFGDELQTSADKLQITAEALQELQFAAEETDVPLESLEAGLAKLNGTIGAFKTGIGGKKVAGAFEALGISKESLDDVTDATQLLPILADRLGQVSDTASQVQIARKLGIEDLLPLLRQGSNGLAEMRDRARELGLVISNDTVKALADADRQMELATRQIQANLRVAFSGLAVDIAKATAGLAEFLTALRQSQAGWAVFLRTLSRGPGAAFNATIDLIPIGRTVRARGRENAARAGGRQRIADIQDALSKPLPKPDTGSGFELDLPRSGGSKGKTAKEIKDTTAQREAEVDSALRDVERDFLAAWDRLLVNADARADVATQLLSLEQEARNAAIDKQKADIAADEGLSAAKKAELTNKLEIVRGEEEKVARLKQDAIDREASRQKSQEALQLQQADIDAQSEAVNLALAMARTASDRRALELELLDLADRRAQAELDAINAVNGSTEAEIAIAQKKKAQLEATRGGREAQVRQNTQGPLESMFDSLPQTADEVNERMEALAANGISDVVDGLAQAINGTRSLGDVFKSVIAQMAVDLTRLNLQRALAGLIGSFGGSFGGSGGGFFSNAATSGSNFNFTLPGMADGGPVRGPGTGRSDSVPAMLSNGEFVVSAAAARKHGAWLAAINAGREPHMKGGGLFSLGLLGALGIKHPAASLIPGLRRANKLGPGALFGGVGKLPNLSGLLGKGGGNSTSHTFSPTLNLSVQPHPGMTMADARRTGAQVGAAAMREMALAKRRGF